MVAKRKGIYYSEDEDGFVSDSGSELSEGDKELQEAFARNEIDSEKLNCMVPYVPRDKINNVDGLNEILKKIKLDLPWVERLDLINDLAPVAPELEDHLKDDDDDVGENDFKREVIFYRQAQGAVLEGIPRLKKLGVPSKRPDDYFAEMLKTDDHMQKVRQVLINKEASMERREKVRKMRELRKYGKKVQTEVIQQRAKEKRELLESVKKFRKGQKNKLDFLELDDDEETEESNRSVLKEKRGQISNKAVVKGNKKGQKKKPEKNSNTKRTAKNDKYGFGGRKKRSKYNNAESSAEVDRPRSNSRSSKMGGKQKFGNKKKNLKSNRRKGRK